MSYNLMSANVSVDDKANKAVKKIIITCTLLVHFSFFLRGRVVGGGGTYLRLCAY